MPTRRHDAMLHPTRATAALTACLILACMAEPRRAGADVEREGSDPILRLDLPGHTSEVRALAFFPDGRLVSGGRDKVAMVWDARPAAAGTRDVGRRRVRDRVIRWQVARGTRGAIQALATAPAGEPVVAIAGSGAMGSTGEIVVVDAGDGTLHRVLGGGDRTGHRSSVVGLDFSTDGAWLFSSDVDGQVFAWNRQAEWQPVELAAREETRLGYAAAQALRRLPATRPVAAVKDGRVALPALVAEEGATVPDWRIDLVQPPAAAGLPADRRPLPSLLRGAVLALDATPDGRFLAAADLTGRVVVWDLAAAEPRPAVLEIAPAAESLALSADGGRLVVGVATKPGSPARLEVWDVPAARRVGLREMPAPVRAVAASATGDLFAAAGGFGHEILLERFDGLAAAADAAPRPGRRLGGVGRRIGRLAFAQAAAERPPARLAIGVVAAGEERLPVLTEAFDLEGLAVGPAGAGAEWAPAAGDPAGWALARAADQREGFEVWQLSRDGRAAGVVELDLTWQGRLGPAAACVAWLTRPGAASPWAVALGTDRGIFVHAVADRGPCPVVRRYRGHEDGVLSLAVSADGRWLASGGRDGLVMLWPLAGIGSGRPLFERFGIGIRVENGRAVVESIDESGPLAGRDVRVGDVITKVSWSDGEGPQAARREAADGAAVSAALPECPWWAQVSWEIEREGKKLETFHRLPAWENIAALHLAANREWAWWSPRGYYAASANGDTLFGWLVNRGVDKLPRFFRANQFRRRLERPDVMARLLAAGSLGAALRAAGRDVPKSSAVVLPELFVATPEVKIVTPRSDTAVAAAALEVTADVDIPAGVTLSRMRAYASGVAAAGAARLVAEQPAAEGRPARRTYAWRLPLPDEDEQLVQVFVGTEAGPTDVAEVTLAAPAKGAPANDGAPDPARRRPRMFLLAAGVDRYAHSERFAAAGLTDLAFAGVDARTLHDALVRSAGSRYDIAGSALLLDAAVTRTGWRDALATLAAKLADGVAPDDLIVIFLAGHGMIDDGAGREYCYLCHDVELRDAPAGVVPERSGSITWRDFAPLDALPCRKVALVDTCHSGGLGPAARATAVREFQENMVLVLAAASDAEASQESADWGHGAFTKCLLEGLSGRADGRGAARLRTTAQTGPRGPDGAVTLDEIVDYVTAEVPALTLAAGQAAQHPSVSPAGLVPFVTLPLGKATSGGQPAPAP